MLMVRVLSRATALQTQSVCFPTRVFIFAVATQVMVSSTSTSFKLGLWFLSFHFQRSDEVGIFIGFSPPVSSRRYESANEDSVSKTAAAAAAASRSRPPTRRARASAAGSASARATSAGGRRRADRRAASVGLLLVGRAGTLYRESRYR